MNPRDCLRRYPLFGLLTVRQLEACLAAAMEKSYPTGKTIFQEGTRASWACLVLNGRVRVVRATPSGREALLGKYQPGELFGEYGLLPPHHNMASCRAASDTRLLRLPLDVLRQNIDVDLWGNLKSWLRLHGMIAYLRGRAYLGFMSATTALTHFDKLETVRYPAGHSIQAAGLNADRWFYIDNGEVTLELSGGEEQLSSTLTAGDCFGETALRGYTNLPHVVARTEVVCRFLTAESFAPGSHSRTAPSLQTLLPTLARNWRLQVWVGQREEADCGLACLAMIARLLRRETVLEDLRGNVQLGTEGLSLLELEHLAATLGLCAQAVRVDPQRLAEVQLPAIAHQKNGHYVVLFDRESTGLTIGDPASGIATAGEAVFAASWSGNLLLVRKG